MFCKFNVVTVQSLLKFDITARIKYLFLNSIYIILWNFAVVHMFQKNDVAAAWTFITGRGGEVAQYSQAKLGF